MPWPPKDLFIQLAKLNFCSKSIMLPMRWQEPGDHYPNAFQPGEKAVPPNIPLNLFREETLNKYHVGSAQDIGKQFETYIEGICGAIHSAVDQWRQMAMISGVVITGPVATVRHGGRASADAVDHGTGSEGNAAGAEIHHGDRQCVRNRMAPVAVVDQGPGVA